MPKTNVYDKRTQTNYVVDDISKFRDSSRYEILTAETAKEARRKELDAMTRKELDEFALTLNLKPIDYKLKPEVIDAILLAESGENADNA